MNDRAPFPRSFRPAAPAASSGDLSKRVASSVVLAALAIITTAVGGWPFVVLWGAAAIVVYWEWSSMVARQGKVTSWRLHGARASRSRRIRVGSGRGLCRSPRLRWGAIAVAALTHERRRLWCAGGVIYAGVLAVAPVVIRVDRPYGAVAVFFLFAVVWVTDIFGYFIGRLVRGPKLAVRISPKKTWAGAVGGALGAVVAGVVFAALTGYSVVGSGATAFVLSLVSQGGDLIESGFKRHFGVKDASHVIPGHGGLMDRLDGFIAAAGVAVLIGIVRAGSGEAAQGLLLW